MNKTISTLLLCFATAITILYAHQFIWQESYDEAVSDSTILSWCRNADLESLGHMKLRMPDGDGYVLNEDEKRTLLAVLNTIEVEDICLKENQYDNVGDYYSLSSYFEGLDGCGEYVFQYFLGNPSEIFVMMCIEEAVENGFGEYHNFYIECEEFSRFMLSLGEV